VLLRLLDGLDRAADDAELVADLGAHEHEGDDCDDCDESKDECVFGQSLTVVPMQRLMDPGGDPPNVGHVFTSFPAESRTTCLEQADCGGLFDHGMRFGLAVNSPLAPTPWWPRTT
jgi:hypothetical protein